MRRRGVRRVDAPPNEVVPRRRGGGEGQTTAPSWMRLTAAWDHVVTTAHLEVEASPDAEPFEDARIVAAIVAVLHEAADRARSAVLVEVRSDGSVRVHDDGGPPPRRLGVLATTARDALRDLGADLDEGPSDRLVGSVVRIVRPPSAVG